MVAVYISVYFFNLDVKNHTLSFQHLHMSKWSFYAHFKSPSLRTGSGSRRSGRRSSAGTTVSGWRRCRAACWIKFLNPSCTTTDGDDCDFFIANADWIPDPFFTSSADEESEESAYLSCHIFLCYSKMSWSSIIQVSQSILFISTFYS